MHGAEISDDWYSDQTSTFGDRVAAAREHVSMSEDDLARRLGIKIETLRKWENDVAEPRANKLQMLAGMLNVSLRWLLTGEGEEIDGPAPDAAMPGVSDILREIRSIRSDMSRNIERLGVLEKRLRLALHDAA